MYSLKEITLLLYFQNILFFSVFPKVREIIGFDYNCWMLWRAVWLKGYEMKGLRMLGRCFSIDCHWISIQWFGNSLYTFSWGILNYCHAREQEQGLSMAFWFHIVFICNLSVYLGTQRLTLFLCGFWPPRWVCPYYWRSTQISSLLWKGMFINLIKFPYLAIW